MATKRRLQLHDSTAASDVVAVLLQTVLSAVGSDNNEEAISPSLFILYTSILIDIASQYSVFLKPRLHDTTGCITGLTTGCIV